MKNDSFDIALTVIGSVASLIGVVEAAINSIHNQKLTLSVVGTLLIILGLSIALISNKRIRYSIKKRLLFLSRNADSYWIKYKEIRYIFNSKHNMEHKKKHTIVSQVHQLCEFTDKFKWSAPQRLESMDIQCGDEATDINCKRVENWNQYELMFPATGMRQKRTVSIHIRNLEDNENEALPFLSTSIVTKTKKFTMIVEFRDPTLIPENIRYKIFDNYASIFPIFDEEIAYNADDRRIEVSEEYPIYGYRYVITWDFK